MTPEEQQIALAEWRGWKNIRELDDLYPDGEVAAGIWWQGIPPEDSPLSGEQLLPDYLNDLNAVHELEEKLRENSHAWAKYGEQLQEIVNHYPVGVVPDYHRDLRSLASVAHATAAHRGEALLKALNLWKP